MFIKFEENTEKMHVDSGMIQEFIIHLRTKESVEYQEVIPQAPFLNIISNYYPERGVMNGQN